MPLTRIKTKGLGDAVAPRVNIVDTGTEGTKVAAGTTGQRGSTAGQFRFNQTTGLAEYYDGSSFKSIDSPPAISSISPTTEDAGNANIVITGSNFASGATVKFIGADNSEISSPSVTFNSNTQLTATTPSSGLSAANEPYDVKVTNVSGLSVTLADALDAGGIPAWTTASGQIGGTITEGDTVNTTVVATDPDSTAITYSVASGSLPSGLSLNTSTGAITGTAPAVSSDTTSSFTLGATSGADTTTRAFNIIVKNFSVTDINSIPENIWNNIPTGQFASNSTYTDYYGGRFDVNSGNVMQFRSEFSSEHVMYQRANSRSNSNEECYVQMYDIADAFGDGTNGTALMMFGIYTEDPTGIGTNNNTPFGYVATGNTDFRYNVWSNSQNNSQHGFFHGGANRQNDNNIGNASTNRDSYADFDLNSYQLASTPTSASTKTAITYVIKPDNHGSNARKVYVYYGNTKVHTFTNLIPASKEIHWWCATGHSSSSNGDYWTNNPVRIRYGDNNGNTDYDVGG